MGLVALRARSDEGKLFPNLALFLQVNERRRPDRRREWPISTIIAAAGGIAGDEDFPPEEWESILDDIERFATQLQRGSGSAFPAAKPPPRLPR